MLNNFSNDYIIDVIKTSKTKTEMARRLDIDYKSMNGTKLNKLLDEYAHSVGCEIDVSCEKRYQEHPRFCKQCGKELTFKQRHNLFCSSTCATTYNNSRRILSNDVKTKMKSIMCQVSVKHHIEQGAVECEDGHYHFLPIRVCVVCGNEFKPEITKSGKISRKQTCSNECAKKLMTSAGRKIYEKRVKDGTFEGWKTRNITSYAEKFFINVLNNNNLSYEREKYIEGPGYFLDFVLTIGDNKVDLEIDGKQHKYPERLKSDIERDKYLSSIGYKIYRIPWNEICTDEGKRMMEEKINNFLCFLNTLSSV